VRVLIYVSELDSPYISLLVCPTPSSFLVRFKRIIWWQDYIKPTGFSAALLANISSSPQVHRHLPSSPIGPFLLCSELGAWGRGAKLNPFPSEEWFANYRTLRF